MQKFPDTVWTKYFRIVLNTYICEWCRCRCSFINAGTSVVPGLLIDLLLNLKICCSVWPPRSHAIITLSSSFKIFSPFLYKGYCHHTEMFSSMNAINFDSTILMTNHRPLFSFNSLFQWKGNVNRTHHHRNKKNCTICWTMGHSVSLKDALNFFHKQSQCR